MSGTTSEKITEFNASFKSVMSLWNNLEFMEKKYSLLYHNKSYYCNSKVLHNKGKWILNMEVYEE